MDIKHKDFIVARIDNKSSLLTIDMDVINSFRSVKMRSDALTTISEQIKFHLGTFESFDDPYLHSADIVLKAIGKPDFSSYLNSIEASRNNVVRLFNAVLFMYTEVWFDCRKRVYDDLHPFLKNIADPEIIIISSSIAFHGLETTKDIFTSLSLDMPIIKREGWSNSELINTSNRIAKHYFEDGYQDNFENIDSIEEMVRIVSIII